MREELETYQLIQRYISNELNESELAEFNVRLHSDASLLEEVEYQKLVNEVVVGAQYHSIREKMSSDIKKIDSKSPVKFWMVALGTIVLISGISWISVLITNPKKKEVIVTPIEESKQTQSVIAQSTTSQTPLTSTSGVKKNTTEKPILSAASTITETSTTSDGIEEKILKESNTSLTQEIKQETASIKKIDCSSVQLQAEITAMPSCESDATGSIQLNAASIKGGSAPYQWKFNEQKSNATQYYKLSSGSYFIEISDQSGCKKSFAIDVPEKPCKETSFAFNPSIGETWLVPVKAGSGFKVSIRSRGGKLLYQAIYESGTPAEWGGISNGGAEVEAGLYIYLIEYSDGERETGQISIIR